LSGVGLQPAVFEDSAGLKHCCCGCQNSGNPKGSDDSLFRDPLKHKMIVQRAAQQQSASGAPEPCDLRDDAQGFDGKHSSGGAQQPFSPGLQAQQSQCGPHRKGSCIAHEDSGRIPVEPQKRGCGCGQDGSLLTGRQGGFCL
jgi:hypothetical protein